MSEYQFDEVPDRRGTGSLKWDTGGPEVLPFWVADMDFPAPDFITDALADRISHPVFGYSLVDKEYLEALSLWYRDRHLTPVTPRDILLAPGVMPAIALALRALTNPADGVLVMTPVYRPFLDVVRLGGRELVEVPLVLEGRRWTFDADVLEQALIGSRDRGNPVKVLLFCSPHNPVGRVWDEGELRDISRLAEEYDLTVFSDEIHQDLVYPPHRHRVLADFTPELRKRTVVFSSLSKSFNLAGLPLAHMVTFHPPFREALRRGLEGEFFHHPDVLAQTAAKAAALRGGPWLEELRTVVQENYNLLCRRLPVGMVDGLPAPLEGTYLAWIDFSPLIRKKNLSGDEELARMLEQKAGIRLSPGSWFGGPHGYLRINLACPPGQLEEGLSRLVSFR